MTFTFALASGEVLHAVRAHSLRLALQLALNDHSVWRAGGAHHTPTLPAVVLAAEGTELLGTQHALFTEGVWHPDSTWGRGLIAS